MEKAAAVGPAVRHRLRRRLAVDVHEDRIPLRPIEVRRRDQVAIHADAVAGVHGEALGGGIEGAVDLRFHRRGVGHASDHFVVGQRDDLAKPRVDERRECVDGEAAVRGHAVEIGAGKGRRRHAHWRRTAIEPCAIQVALGRIVRRGDEIELGRPLVHGDDRDEVHVAARDERFGPVPGDAIGVHPAVLLAEHEKPGSLAEDARLRQAAVPYRDERVVVVAPHAAHRTCRGIRQDVVVGVLEPIELLDRNGVPPHNRPHLSRPSHGMGDRSPLRMEDQVTASTIPQQELSEDIQRSAMLTAAWKLACLTDDIPPQIISAATDIPLDAASGLINLRRQIVEAASPEGFTEQEFEAVLNTLLATPAHWVASAEGRDVLIDMLRTNLAFSRGRITIH